MTLNADKANTMAVLRPQVRLTQGSEPGPARFTTLIQRSRAVAAYSEYSLALAQPCLPDQAQSAVEPIRPRAPTASRGQSAPATKDREEMPRPSQRGAILEAALECFADQGYDATRVKHIADRAGVAESAMYRHFPSKEAIAQELYAAFISRYAESLKKLAKADVSPKAKLSGIVHLILDTYRSEPAAFTFVVINTNHRLPKLPKNTAYPLDVIEAVVAEGQRAGVVRAGQPNLLAAILLGAIQQPVVLATLGSEGALNLLQDHTHDRTIEAAALAALGIT